MGTVNIYAPPGHGTRVRVQCTTGGGGAVRIAVEDETVDGAPDTPPAWNEAAGKWSSVDREGCNALIRAVREARDKAYGRDE